MLNRTQHEHTTGWHGLWRVWRIQVGWRVWRHSYQTSGDRWVIEPRLIYDRKNP